MKCIRLLMLMLSVCMTSACGVQEPPKTASDFCLLDTRISTEPAPQQGVTDVGNEWDSEPTFREVLKHNETYDRLCPKN